MAGSVPRGTRSSDRKRSPQPEAPSGGVGGRPQAPGVGGSERVAFVWRSRGWSVGGERARWVGAATAGRGKSAGVGSVPALAAAATAASAAQPRVCVPAGLQFMARAAEGRRGGRRQEAPAQRRSQLARSLALARGSGAPGTTSRPAEMTRGLLPPKISLRSPRVRGARSTSPPPARRRAVPPPGPTAGAPSVCACVCQRAPAAGVLPDRRPGAGCSRSRLPAPGPALGQTRAGRACAVAPEVLATQEARGCSRTEPGGRLVSQSGAAAGAWLPVASQETRY